MIIKYISFIFLIFNLNIILCSNLADSDDDLRLTERESQEHAFKPRRQERLLTFTTPSIKESEKKETTESLSLVRQRTVSEFVSDEIKQINPDEEIVLFDFDDTLFDSKKRKGRSDGLIDFFRGYNRQGVAYIYTSGQTFFIFSEIIGLKKRKLTVSEIQKFYNYQKLGRCTIETSKSSLLYRDVFSVQLGEYFYYFPEYHTFYAYWRHLKGDAVFGVKGENLEKMVHFLNYMNNPKQLQKIYFIDDLQKVVDAMLDAGNELKHKGILPGGVLAIHVPVNGFRPIRVIDEQQPK
jgi:hypothetical protein